MAKPDQWIRLAAAKKTDQKKPMKLAQALAAVNSPLIARFFEVRFPAEYRPQLLRGQLPLKVY